VYKKCNRLPTVTEYEITGVRLDDKEGIPNMVWDMNLEMDETLKFDRAVSDEMGFAPLDTASNQI